MPKRLTEQHEYQITILTGTAGLHSSVTMKSPNVKHLKSPEPQAFSSENHTFKHEPFGETSVGLKLLRYKKQMRSLNKCCYLQSNVFLSAVSPFPPLSPSIITFSSSSSPSSQTCSHTSNLLTVSLFSASLPPSVVPMTTSFYGCGGLVQVQDSHDC